MRWTFPKIRFGKRGIKSATPEHSVIRTRTKKLETDLEPEVERRGSPPGSLLGHDVSSLRNRSLGIRGEGPSAASRSRRNARKHSQMERLVGGESKSSAVRAEAAAKV